MESLDQCRRLEEREKARVFFVMSLRFSKPQGVTQHRIFIKFFSISHVFRTSNLEFKEFNNTIIPFALVGYETG